MEASEGAEEESPRPKWWLLHATNYLVMGVFVGSVFYHIRESKGSRFQRDASSLLPMLLIWSGCMAYFFGFFGISFVDKDEDLDVQLEEAALEDWRREVSSDGAKKSAPPPPPARRKKRLAAVAEEDNGGGATTVIPACSSAKKAPSSSEPPSWTEAMSRMRVEKDAARAEAAVAGKATHLASAVGPVCVDGIEVIVPLAGASLECRRLADRGARALHLCGGARTSKLDGRSGRKASFSCCVAAPTAAAAEALATQAEAAIAVGRCVYVARDDLADARRAADELAKLGGAFVAGVAAASPTPDGAVVAEATLPGPIVRRVLGASVSDLCAAIARRELARDAATCARGASRALEPWTRRSLVADALDALASAVGEPLPPISAVGRLAIEAVNRNRDLHVSISVPAIARRAFPKPGTFLDLVHDDDRVKLDRVLAATLLGLDLAQLAATVLPTPPKARCG